MDEQNILGGIPKEEEAVPDYPVTPELPDPAALPESYGEEAIPDPVAPPESYGETAIPDPVAPPESYGETAIPDPAAPPESYGGSAIPNQVPNQSDAVEDYAGDQYSWNGREYVQTGDGDAVSSAPQPNSYTPPVSTPPVYNQNNTQNTYQNAYQNNTGLDPNLESRANTVKVLGIISIILSIVGCGCCGIIAPILSIVGLVKASGMSTVIPMMSDTAKQKLSSGKKLCIAGIVIYVVIFILSFFFSIIFPAMIGYMEKAESTMYY